MMARVSIVTICLVQCPPIHLRRTTGALKYSKSAKAVPMSTDTVIQAIRTKKMLYEAAEDNDCLALTKP